jgi:hypothetical protein
MLEGLDEDDSHGKPEEERKVMTALTRMLCVAADWSHNRTMLCIRVGGGGGPIPHFTRLI